MTFNPAKSPRPPYEYFQEGSSSKHRAVVIEAVTTNLSRVQYRLDRIDNEDAQGYGPAEFDRLVDNAVDLVRALVALEREGRAYFGNVDADGTTTSEGELNPLTNVKDRILTACNLLSVRLDDVNSTADPLLNGLDAAGRVEFPTVPVADEVHRHDSSPSVGCPGGCSDCVCGEPNPTEGDAGDSPAKKTAGAA